MPKLNISIIDVGHGNCAVLSGPKNVIVIDAGPGISLLEFLEQEKIYKINTLLISHADKDHLEGIISILESETVEVELIKVNTDSAKPSRLWDDLTFELDRANRKGSLTFEIGLTTNDSGKFRNESITVEVLAPSPYLAAKGPGSTDRQRRRLTSNSNSAVVRLNLQDKPLVVFMGDVDQVGLENIEESGEDLQTPLAIFPHHGGKSVGSNLSNFTSLFYRLVKPKSVIFSIGRGHYNTTQPQIIEILLSNDPNLNVYCTQISENCSTELSKIAPTHLANRYSRGRECNKCCSGTILIEIESSNFKMYPTKDAHENFVKEHLPQAICKI